MVEKFSDKVKKEINYVREVNIKFPTEVYVEFSNYAKETSADCYWLAVKNLLAERKNTEKFDKLSDRIDKLEILLNEPQEQPENKKVFKGFGKEE